MASADITIFSPTVTFVSDVREEQRKLYFEEEKRLREDSDRQGKETEQKLIDALEVILKSPEKPIWLLGYEKAEFLDDHATKIDLWILSDLGKFGIQIKTSRGYAKKFVEDKKARMYHPDAHVIVVGPNSTIKDVLSGLNRAYATHKVRSTDAPKRKPWRARPKLKTKSKTEECEVIV